MSKTLTISIAAYNVEKYIKETLESLVVPEVIDDIEVFIVDDGGNDNTLAIAKEYEKKYPNSFHAVHKTNGGYGSVFNLTISMASGVYYKLLDGDDWFDKKGLIDLVNKLKNATSDVVITNFYKGPNKDELAEAKVLDDSEKTVIDSVDFYRNKPIGMWALVYKTSVLRESNLRLTEHSLYTDQYYSTIPFLYAKTVELFPIYVYCYSIGYDEQSASRMSRIRHTDEMLSVCASIASFAEENKAKSRYIMSRAAIYHTTAIRTIMLDKININNMKRIKNYDEEIHKSAPSVYKEAEKMGKIGKFIKLLRATNYYTYLILKIKPGGISNWQ